MAEGSDLARGQITGIVLGSVGGALLLALLACLFYYLCANRRRQTGDLTWAKSSDLEAAAAGAGGHTPHEPLPGAPSSEVSAVSPASGPGEPYRPSAISTAGLDGVPRSPIDAPSASMEAVQASPTDGLEYKRMSSRGRSTGSGFAAFLGGQRNFLRNSVKDKHLEVSRSARVEPSAEVEMTEPFEPAATNMGPPLSKSSMLLRWLNGADDSHAEAVAAQLAAAAAAVAATENGADRGGSRSARAHAGSPGGAGGLNPFSDRLPLLSLAAQQSGIVWSKMPPSVTSSPAVSMVESSSMHMLRGTWKRSDGPDEAALKAALGSNPGGVASSSASWLATGGDDRYPPSLALASVEALRKRNSLQADRPGIVFDYVNTTPNNSRAATSGGAPSRVPTIGGAVLPLPPAAGTAEYGTVYSSSGGGASTGMPAGRGGAVGSPLSSAGGAPPAVAAGAGGSLLGQMPDENLFAQVLSQQERLQVPPGPELSRSSGIWLHQGPPTKLAALREADTEGEAADEAASPAAASSRPGAAAGPLPPGPPSPDGESTPRLLVRPEQQPFSLAPRTTGHSLLPYASPQPLPYASAGPAPAPAAAGSGGTAARAAATLSSKDGAVLPPLMPVRTGWTHFSEGDGGWSSQRATVNSLASASAAGGGGVSAIDTCLSPDASMPLSSHSRVTPNGTSMVTSPLSPFLPQPPGAEGTGTVSAAASAAAAAAASASANFSTNGMIGGHSVTSDSGAAVAATPGLAGRQGGYGGMAGLHHVVLRANSAIAASVSESTGQSGMPGNAASGSRLDLPEGVSLAGDEPVKMPAASPGMVAAAAAALAVAAASGASPSSERMSSAVLPSMKRRVVAPAPVVPPSHSESLRSMKSMNSSISPSMGLHFPEMPSPWGVESAAASRPPEPVTPVTAAAGSAATAAGPMLGPAAPAPSPQRSDRSPTPTTGNPAPAAVEAGAAASVRLLPVSTSSKATL